MFIFRLNLAVLQIFWLFVNVMLKLKLFLIISIVFFSYESLYSETLKQTLIDSYKYYPDINKSKIDLTNKQKDLSISKTDFLPSIDLSMSRGRSLTRSSPDTSNFNYNELNPTTLDVDISQPLGATKYLNLKKAQNSLKAGKFNDQSVIQGILHRATLAFYTVLKDRFLLDVALKNENNLKIKFEATEKRFDFKDVTKTDVFQAKARLADAQSKTIEARNNLDIAVSEYIAVVGREPDINWYEPGEKKITSSNPKDWSKFGEMPNTPSSMNEAVEYAIQNNPEINKLRYDLENALIGIQTSQLDFLPEFSISGSYGKSMESARTINRKETYEITADVTIPIFNKGHNFYKLEKSKNTSLALQESLNSKKINLTHDVQSSWKKMESLKSSILSLEQSVKSNEIALEGVTKEAGVGQRTTLNILDAEKELTQAEASLVNSRFQLITSAYSLLKACGLLNFEYLGINK